MLQCSVDLQVMHCEWNCRIPSGFRNWLVTEVIRLDVFIWFYRDNHGIIIGRSG